MVNGQAQIQKIFNVTPAIASYWQQKVRMFNIYFLFRAFINYQQVEDDTFHAAQWGGSRKHTYSAEDHLDIVSALWLHCKSHSLS